MQSTFSIRMDEDLKRDFNRFCDNVGMTMSTAFVIFAKTAVRERRFPFEIGERPLRERRNDADDVAARARRAFETLRAEAERREGPEVTIEEINAEIAAARAERHARERTKAQSSSRAISGIIHPPHSSSHHPSSVR